MAVWPTHGAVRRVAACFGWEARSVEVVGHGHINTSFFVDTPAGPYVVQRLNNTVLVDPAGITANILAVHHHLRGELVPTPVATPDGDWLVPVHDGVWRAFARVPDTSPTGTPDPVRAEQAGTLLGRFHARLADLSPSTLTTTLPGFHDLRRRVTTLRRVVEADPCGRVGISRDEIEMAWSALALMDAADALVRDVPVRVAHNDAKLDNVLFRGSEAVCIVDLDTLMPGARWWDVGDLVRTTSTTAHEDERLLETVRVDPELYQAVVTGYRQAVATGPVTQTELEAVDAAGAIVTYEQAIRFLTDWLAGDVYYRTERPGHNRDRARAQFRLLATLPSPVAW